jgi:hypothetical protein
MVSKFMSSLNIEFETVKKQCDEWRCWYDKNNQRGRDDLLFYLGDQTKVGVSTDRANSNKETLVCNISAKQIKRASAQLMETEFSLNLSPTNENSSKNVQENNAFRKVLNTIMLSDDNVNKLVGCGDKCIKFGYSFLEINFERRGKEDLCLWPVFRLHNDPTIAFWDKSANHQSRIDGRFCGMKKVASKEEIYQKLCYIGKKTLDSCVHKDDNEIYYYWFREYHEKKYRLLKNGKYKKSDKINNEDAPATEEDSKYIFESLSDEEKYAQNNKPSPLEKSEPVSCIYFQIFINEKPVTKPKIFPTDELPLVYHHGLTEWEGNNSMRTIPLIEFLKDPQKLHNYMQSQIATIAKNSSSAKWFFNDDHILSDTQQAEAKEINSLEGAFMFGGDLNAIKYFPPGELPMSLLQMSQLSKQEIDEIGGAMIDAQQSDSTVISGVAIDKITHNIGLLNLFFLGAHINFVRTVGCIVKQMIPRIITEERTIIAKSIDGSGEAIIVNKDMGTGDIQNNIKDINNNFDYDITPGANSPQQKENARKSIQEFIAQNPQAAPLIGDILMRNLDIQDSGELERRLSANMNQSLIKYGRGEISLQEYQASMQKQQQQNLQMQANAYKADPQYQATHEMAMSDNKKADAMQADSQTKRIAVMEQEKTKRLKIMSDAKNNLQKIELQIEQMMQNSGIAAGNQQLEIIEKQLKATQQLIDASEIEDARQETDRHTN